MTRELTKQERQAMDTDRARLLPELEGKPPLSGINLLLVVDGFHESGFIAGLEYQQAEVDRLREENNQLRISLDLAEGVRETNRKLWTQVESFKAASGPIIEQSDRVDWLLRYSNNHDEADELNTAIESLRAAVIQAENPQ